MTALNFPDSPTNGEVYEGYIYDSSDNVWNRLPEAPGINLENLGNVSGTPTAGDSLIYDGSNWLNTPQKNRNLLYNGAMQVAQRGTSATGVNVTGYYTADRFRANISSLGTWTQTVQTDGPTGSGFTKSWKIECTTTEAAPAGTTNAQLLQVLEGQDLQSVKKGTSAAEQLTMSFWVKSNVTGTYVVNFVDDDNSRSVSASYTVSASAAWEKKTIVFPADTTGAFDNDNAGSLRIIWWLAAGADFSSGALNTSWESTTNANRAVGQTNLAAATNNYWQITGAQLEVGPVATPFEFKSFGQELAECQRYYYRTEPGAANSPLSSPGRASAATQAFCHIQFPGFMRTSPSSMDFSSLTLNTYGVGSFAVTNLTFSNARSDGALVTATVASGLSTGVFYHLGTSASANVGHLGFGAEL
jgi:hypothetical protein